MMMNYYVTDIPTTAPTPRGDYKVRAYDIDGDERIILGDLYLPSMWFKDAEDVRAKLEPYLEEDAKKPWSVKTIEVYKPIAKADVRELVKPSYEFSQFRGI